MNVCVQFVSCEDPIAVYIRPATKSTFKKYRKQTIVKSCLSRHLHRQLRGAGGEKQHDVILASTVIALIAVPHLSRKASVGKDDLIADVELSHYLIDSTVIKETVVADQSTGDAVPTEIKHDDIIFIGFAEHRVHCLYDVISGRVGIRVADRLGIFVLLKNIVNAYNKKESKLAEEEKREPELMPPISSHTLRHTGCTRLGENNVNPKVMQYVMGCWMSSGHPLSADRSGA